MATKKKKGGCDIKEELVLIQYMLDIVDIRIRIMESKLKDHIYTIDAHKEPISRS